LNNKVGCYVYPFPFEKPEFKTAAAGIYLPSKFDLLMRPVTEPWDFLCLRA